jgi:hypothetical protein
MKTKAKFSWPNGKRAAISLSFDDARLSQVDRGLPILDGHGVKATFYVTPRMVRHRLDGWRRAVANGHEIGNHTLTHPCTGNFRWSRKNALEDYTLARMEEEIVGANEAVRKMLGLTPRTFAYPCSESFVGRGRTLKSYVPLVARHFVAGRSAFNETTNDPMFCDLAQVQSIDADRGAFAKLQPFIENAVANGDWVVFFGHEVGEEKHQTVPAETLERLCRYAQDPANGLWIDTVAAVADYIAKTRKAIGGGRRR